MSDKNTALLLQSELNKPSSMARFTSMLGERQAQQFKNALISIVANNPDLQKCSVSSILGAANAIATMNLSITPSLGLAGVLPYKDVAQVQIFRDGYIELLQRTGLVATLVNEVVREGELVYKNKFRDEYRFDESKRVSDKVIGYMAYVKLTTGFEKTVYMTVDECEAHAKQYSATYRKGFGLWKTKFDDMALKTVLRKLIKKYLPKNTILAAAIVNDQAVFKDDSEDTKPQYVDNAEPTKPCNEVVDVDAVDVEQPNQ